MYSKPSRRNLRLFTIVSVIFATVLGLFASGAAAQAGPEVIPTVECVRDLGANANPRYEAHFSYNNTTANPISGAAITQNTVTGGTADPGVPTTFLPGQHDPWPNSVFFVPFDGTGDVVWTVDTANQTPQSATASL